MLLNWSLLKGATSLSQFNVIGVLCLGRLVFLIKLRRAGKVSMRGRLLIEVTKLFLYRARKGDPELSFLLFRSGALTRKSRGFIAVHG